MRHLKGERGWSLLETIIVISILIVLVGVALPMFTDLYGTTLEKQVQYATSAGNEALRLDFAKQMMTAGQYTSPFSDDKQKVGKQLRQANQEALEAMLQITGYSDGVKWIFVQAATPISPPIVAGEIR